MKKGKFILSLVLAAVISSVLTLTALYFLLGLNGQKISNLTRFLAAMRFVEMRYVDQVDDTRLIDGAIAGMLGSLDDPHSLYLDEDMYKLLISHTEGSFGGIGVVMGFQDNKVTILAVMEGTPGEKAGLKVGDEIVAVDGVPATSMQPEETALSIRGDAGTEVVLTIKRAGEADRDYTLCREDIKVRTAAGQMLSDNIGYIRIASFSENTAQEFKEAYQDLQSKGMTGLVLDLRQNPGGLVTSSVDIADVLVPKGTIVSVVQRDGSKEEYDSDLEEPAVSMAVLIDGNTASAAEILAGAIQDRGVGVLVGMQTYGKGSVQAVVPMYEGDGLKLTIARYYTPNGRSIDGTGIEPDVVVELPTGTDTDYQLLKAMEILQGK